MASAESGVLPGPAGGSAGARERFGVAEVYAAIGLLSFLVARFVPVLRIHYPCPFLTLTHLPCGTCGMTHAFVELAHGRVAAALSWNPLGAVLAAAVWGFAAADLVRAAAGWPLPRIPERGLRAAVLAGLVAFAANWAFLLLRGR